MRHITAAIALAACLAAPSFAHADCATDFAAMMQAFHDAGPRKVETELTVTSSKPGVTSARTSVARIILPDALDLNMEDSADHNQSEVIVVGGKGFAKIDGGWKALDDEDVGELHTLFLGNGFMGEAPTNIQCLGDKKQGHKAATVYSFEIPGVPKAMRVELYTDPASKRPFKATGSTAIQSGGSDIKVSYTYDPKIKIEAPN